MNRAGDISELRFMLGAVEHGYDVFNPFSHSTKADCIVMLPGGKPIRVQVKKGVREKRCKNPTYKVIVGSAKSSTVARLGGGARVTRYTKSDFDVLAIDLGKHGFSFWKLSDVCHQTTWRWNQSKPSNNWNLLKSLT
jgi:hypothetical protein